MSVDAHLTEGYRVQNQLHNVIVLRARTCVDTWEVCVVLLDQTYTYVHQVDLITGDVAKFVFDTHSKSSLFSILTYL